MEYSGAFEAGADFGLQSLGPRHDRVQMTLRAHAKAPPSGGAFASARTRSPRRRTATVNAPIKGVANPVTAAWGAVIRSRRAYRPEIVGQAVQRIVISGRFVA